METHIAVVYEKYENRLFIDVKTIVQYKINILTVTAKSICLL